MPSLVFALTLISRFERQRLSAQRVAHRRDVRRELRPLDDDRRIDVGDRANRPHAARPRTPSSVSESASFQRGSVSGKCSPRSPSAAAPSSASQIACVSASPSEWPSGPRSNGIAHAAEHERATFDQPVRVEAVTDAHHVARTAERSSNTACARATSSRCVTLKFSLEASTIATSTPMRSNSAASSVASTPSRRARSCARAKSAAIANCGVCAAQSVRRSSVSHDRMTTRLNDLDRVDHRGGQQQPRARREPRSYRLARPAREPAGAHRRVPARKYSVPATARSPLRTLSWRERRLRRRR